MLVLPGIPDHVIPAEAGIQENIAFTGLRLAPE